MSPEAAPFLGNCVAEQSHFLGFVAQVVGDPILLEDFLLARDDRSTDESPCLGEDFAEIFVRHCGDVGGGHRLHAPLRIGAPRSRAGSYIKYDICFWAGGDENSEGWVVEVALLEGQTAVITGGGQGLGLAIAERFVAEGARVVLGDVNLEATQAAAKQLGGDVKGDGVAVAVRCDVTQSPEVESLIQTAVDEFGGLDIMVNNAGITRDATMRKMTEEQFDQVINVHLKGTWNGTRLAAAIMRENKRGAIINMSSVSGKVGMIGQTNYSAAKAGIVGMTKAAAKELAYLGIRVNAIAPG